MGLLEWGMDRLYLFLCSSSRKFIYSLNHMRESIAVTEHPLSYSLLDSRRGPIPQGHMSQMTPEFPVVWMRTQVNYLLSESVEINVMSMFPFVLYYNHITSCFY